MGRDSRNFITFVRQYFKYDLRREGIAWWKIAKFYLPIGIVVAALALAVLAYVDPFPRQTTVLATGQRGTLSSELGGAFRSYFERHGLRLDIRSRDGLDAVEKDIHDPASDINASFVVSGAAAPSDYPDLVSLGNVAIAPAWLFYRGDTIKVDDPFQYYRDRPIAIGAPGTVSARLFTTLMELNNPGTGDRPNFLKLPNGDAVEQLLAGTIDALFIVDGFASPVIQQLLSDPGVKLMNFPLVDAYVRRLPFLRKVTVPRGAIDVGEIRPESDIALLASSVNLLVEKDTHPSVQWAFLLGAREISLKSDNFFPVADNLPQYRDRSFPLSPIATRFYTSGVPGIFSYLPLWLAALLENVWILLLALLLLGLPTFNKILGYRGFASQKLLWLHFWELRYLEDELVAAQSVGDVESVIARLPHARPRSGRGGGAPRSGLSARCALRAGRAGAALGLAARGQQGRQGPKALRALQRPGEPFGSHLHRVPLSHFRGLRQRALHGCGRGVRAPQPWRRRVLPAI